MLNIGLFSGPIIGGAIYDACDQNMYQTSLWFAIIATVILVTYLIIVYIVFKDQRIKDYDTLDGIKSLDSDLIKDSQKTKEQGDIEGTKTN